MIAIYIKVLYIQRPPQNDFAIYNLLDLSPLPILYFRGMQGT